MIPALTVRDLDVWYGQIHALHGVSLDVEEGRITTLLGANGAGKTTLLRTISGLVKARSGTIDFPVGRTPARPWWSFGGGVARSEITMLPPHEIVARGSGGRSVQGRCSPAKPLGRESVSHVSECCRSKTRLGRSRTIRRSIFSRFKIRDRRTNSGPDHRLCHRAHSHQKRGRLIKDW